MLSCNVGEILAIFVASLMNLATPLLPIQLLWVNLVTDSLPALALGTEKMEKDIMRRKPVPPGEGFFAGGLWMDILLEGCMVGALALLAFVVGCNTYGALEVGRTMCFAVLSLCELTHAVNMRTTQPLYTVGAFSNKKLNIAILVCVLLQVSVIMIPALTGVFHTVTLTPAQWAVVAGLSLVPFAAMESGKLLTSARARTKAGSVRKGTLRAK